MKYQKPQNKQDIEALKWKMSYLENQLTGQLCERNATTSRDQRDKATASLG